MNEQQNERSVSLTFIESHNAVMNKRLTFFLVREIGRFGQILKQNCEEHDGRASSREERIK